MGSFGLIPMLEAFSGTLFTKFGGRPDSPLGMLLGFKNKASPMGLGTPGKLASIKLPEQTIYFIISSEHC